MMAFEVDSDKLELFYLHVLKSSKKFREKQIARGHLIEQLKGLRSLKLPKHFEGKVDAIEHAIDELIKKERRMLKVQEEGSLFQGELKQKISRLDKKLEQYIAISSARDARVKELESKIAEKIRKRDELAQIQGELEGLEIMYHKLKRKNVQAPELLDRLALRIKSLKERASV